MRVILNLIVLVLQGITTFVTLIVIYMIFVFTDYQGGIDSFIGTTLFQPIIGGIISLATIGICLLIGLPLRIVDRINSWWTERFWLAILGAFFGFSLIIISMLPSMKEIINTTIENRNVTRQIPNVVAATTGWFLIAFSLLHIFPPKKMMLWIEGVISKFTG